MLKRMVGAFAAQGTCKNQTLCATLDRRGNGDFAIRRSLCGWIRLTWHTRKSTIEIGRRRIEITHPQFRHHAESDGNGPVDASLKAIESKVQSGAEMLLYSVNAITSGSTESQGEVTVRLQHGGRVVNGVGADPDIVVASAKAYLSALNKLHSKTERVAAQG